MARLESQCLEGRDGAHQGRLDWLARTAKQTSSVFNRDPTSINEAESNQERLLTGTSGLHIMCTCTQEYAHKSEHVCIHEHTLQTHRTHDLKKSQDSHNRNQGPKILELPEVRSPTTKNSNYIFCLFFS